jgi:TonB family protein
MKLKTESGPAWMAWILIGAITAGAALPAQELLKISEVSARQKVVNKEDPVYPPMARQMKITGRVIVEAFIDTQGNVAKVEPVAGNPLLTGAAVNAVKKWTFKPFTADEKPVKTATQLTFSFSLGS